MRISKCHIFDHSKLFSKMQSLSVDFATFQNYFRLHQARAIQELAKFAYGILFPSKPSIAVTNNNNSIGSYIDQSDHVLQHVIALECKGEIDENVIHVSQVMCDEILKKVKIFIMNFIKKQDGIHFYPRGWMIVENFSQYYEPSNSNDGVLISTTFLQETPEIKRKKPMIEKKKFIIPTIPAAKYPLEETNSNSAKEDDADEILSRPKENPRKPLIHEDFMYDQLPMQSDVNMELIEDLINRRLSLLLSVEKKVEKLRTEKEKLSVIDFRTSLEEIIYAATKELNWFKCDSYSFWMTFLLCILKDDDEKKRIENKTKVKITHDHDDGEIADNGNHDGHDDDEENDTNEQKRDDLAGRILDLFIRFEAVLFHSRMFYYCNREEDRVLEMVKKLKCIRIQKRNPSGELDQQGVELFKQRFSLFSDTPKNWFVVNFEKALRTIKQRNGMLYNGEIYLHYQDMIEYFFKQEFSDMLKEKAEDKRKTMLPMLRSRFPQLVELFNRCFSLYKRKRDLRAQKLFALNLRMNRNTEMGESNSFMQMDIEECHGKHSFPLCAAVHMWKLTEPPYHLFHYERLVFGRFLMDAGWPDEAIKTFIKSYSEKNPTTFKKDIGSALIRDRKYRYPCRMLTSDSWKNYGADGTETMCPFRGSPPHLLNDRLFKLGVKDVDKRQEILRIAASKRYIPACDKTFEYFHKTKPSDIPEIDQYIQKPATYTRKAFHLEIQYQKESESQLQAKNNSTSMVIE